MKTRKQFFGLALFAMVFFGLTLTSCTQKEEAAPPPTPEEIEIPQELAFTKKITIQNETGESSVSFTVSANDEAMLTDINKESFIMEPIIGDLPTPDLESDAAPLEKDDAEEEELNLDEMIIINIDEQNLPEGAKGISLKLKEETLQTDRYDRTSWYYYSSYYKKIWTTNNYGISVKMKYYDDHYYAGYRSLCTTVCPRFSYTFSRYDKGVGCEFQYWRYWGHNVGIYFFN